MYTCWRSDYSPMTDTNLSCYTRREGRSVVLAIEGTLDVVTVPQASHAMQRYMLEHGSTMIIDASRLDFIDSKGVGALIAAAKSARDLGGTIYLQNPATPVRKILETCGLMALFPPPPPPTEPVSAPEVKDTGTAAAKTRPGTRKATSGVR